MNRDEVNARLSRIDIKGRPYVQVNQRILAFWELYPNGRIVTQKLSDDGKRCDFLASVYDGDALKATGHSFEYRDGGMVNKTSYVENAETSAIGRALGVLGIGVTESLASADEMQSALEHQGKQKRGAQGNTEAQETELNKARARLYSAANAFCSKNADTLHEKGITTVGEFVAQMIETRSDYAETVEAMDAIAQELYEVSKE